MIADLHIHSDYLPDWFRADMPARVPLPDDPGRDPRGTPIVWAVLGSERRVILADDGGGIRCRYDLAAWRRFVLHERYRVLQRPMYTRLPFHYHVVPGPLRNAAARALLRREGAEDYAPIEQGFEVVEHIWRGGDVPESHRRVVLTHDVDTALGFEWIPPIAQVEMAHGLRSIWHVVACRYALDYDVLDWLVDNGFEIGLHGYNHDGRLAFLPERAQRRRLDACRPLIERYDICHFRSPAWLRNDRLYEVLGDYVRHDFSALDSDGFCPGGAGGCFWTRPFQRERVTVWPTTLPVDELLLFDVSPDRILEIWRDKIEWLGACGGSAVANTHPDPHRSGNDTMLQVYAELLGALQEIHGRSTVATAAL